MHTEQAREGSVFRYHSRLRQSIERRFRRPLLPLIQELVYDERLSFEQAGLRLGVDGTTVRRWLRQLESQPQEATANGTNGTASHSVIGAQQEPPSERIA